VGRSRKFSFISIFAVVEFRLDHAKSDQPMPKPNDGASSRSKSKKENTKKGKAEQRCRSGRKWQRCKQVEKKQQSDSIGAIGHGATKKRPRQDSFGDGQPGVVSAGKKKNPHATDVFPGRNEQPPSRSNKKKTVGSPGTLSKASRVETARADTNRSRNAKKKKQRKNKNQQGNLDNIANDNARKSASVKTKSSPALSMTSLSRPSKMSTLQRAFLERLSSSRFRELNEELYTHSSRHSLEIFTRQPELFEQYHAGFRKQVEEWPVNPIDVIYKKIVKDYLNRNKKEKEGGARETTKVVVADFGCGDAKLAARLLALETSPEGGSLRAAAARKKKKQTHFTNQSASHPFEVHSFDLVSGDNPLVTPADMAAVPLPDESVDVGVHCLALMGTNVADFVQEAWRVLRFGGALKVAEVRSRFETPTSANEHEKTVRGDGKRAKLNNRKTPRNCADYRKQDTDPDGPANSAPQTLIVLDEFMLLMERCGFQCINMDRSNTMFLFMDFIKVKGSSGLSKKEKFTAKPCIYKRR